MGNSFTTTTASGANALTDLATVKAYAGISGTTDDAKLTTLLTSATAAIQNYVDHNIFAADHVEYLSGKYSWGTTRLSLQHCPINSISRVAIKQEVVLEIGNPTAVMPSVRFDSTKAYVSSYASGVQSTTELTLASYPTLADLAAAIKDIGNGWTADVGSGYSTFPTSLIRLPAGALSATKETIRVVAHVQELGHYDIVSADDVATLIGYFPAGISNIEVRYNAGWTTIPTAIQTATCMVVKAINDQSGIDGNLDYEKLGDYSWGRRKLAAFETDPIFADARSLLMKYRRARCL